MIFAERPDVLNHNLETVARLQRAVRPSAGYARSLSVLARAKAAGLTTKSSLIAGLGETAAEMEEALADLAGVGVDIVTIGQYLRPTSNHLPVARWWTPDELTALKHAGEAMGIAHVEAGPLVRSSYHARQAADATPAAPWTRRRRCTAACELAVMLLVPALSVAWWVGTIVALDGRCRLERRTWPRHRATTRRP